MNNYLKRIETKVLDGQLINFDEAVQLVQVEELEDLFAAADRVCKKFNGPKVNLCTIMNVKSGKCGENCKYCAQSGHYQTGAAEYPLVNLAAILTRAQENEREGVHRFAIVTSGRGISDQDFGRILEAVRELKKQTQLSICASLGIIDYKQAVQLKKAGIDHYHHNIETCREYFDAICDTHTYQERIETIKYVTAAGLEVCCGGIIGMGETMEQRIQMAFEIRGLGVKSVPVNILNPIKGTPLENMKVLGPLEILQTLAIYRLMMPDALIRYAGGRSALGDLQRKGFTAGVNAALVGNYLTTVGNKIPDDIAMIKSLSLEV
jgi:biotin synthase